jgi:hypothetical protein
MLGVVRFPQGFSEAPDKSGRAIALTVGLDEFEIREVGGGEVIIGMRSWDSARSAAVSHQHFGVSADGKFGVRAVSMTEWNAAKPLAIKATPRDKDADGGDGNEIGHAGVTLDQSLTSPDGQTVAVLSYTFTLYEPAKPGGFFTFIGGGKYRGIKFLELSDVSSGRKLSAAEVTVDGHPNIYNRGAV